MSFSDTGVHDAARLKELQALPLDRKIAITQARIIEWYNAYEGNVYVSLSGGKDSTVLLHLVRQLFPDVPAVFSNTGLEYPEIQKFAKSFDNVTTVTPKMNFVNVIRTYGYPIISKEVANAIYYARRIRPYNTSSDGGAGQQSENRKNSSACEQTRGGGGAERVNGRSSNCLESDLKTDRNIGQPPPESSLTQNKEELKNKIKESFRRDQLLGILVRNCGEKSIYNKEKWLPLAQEIPALISGKCCDVMKKSPIGIYQRANHRVPFIGTMATESAMRKQAWIRTGCNAFDSKKPSSQPLSFWTEQDILEYIRTYQIEICSVYGDIIQDKSGLFRTTGARRTGW